MSDIPDEEYFEDMCVPEHRPLLREFAQSDLSLVDFANGEGIPTDEFRAILFHNDYPIKESDMLTNMTDVTPITPREHREGAHGIYSRGLRSVVPTESEQLQYQAMSSIEGLIELRQRQLCQIIREEVEDLARQAKSFTLLRTQLEETLQTVVERLIDCDALRITAQESLRQSFAEDAEDVALPRALREDARAIAALSPTEPDYQSLYSMIQKLPESPVLEDAVTMLYDVNRLIRRWHHEGLTERLAIELASLERLLERLLVLPVEADVCRIQTSRIHAKLAHEERYGTDEEKRAMWEDWAGRVARCGRRNARLGLEACIKICENDCTLKDGSSSTAAVIKRALREHLGRTAKNFREFQPSLK